MKKTFKKHRDYGFFDQDIRLSKLTKLGDPLEKLSKGVDFEIFRLILEEKLSKLAKGAGGRPPYDYVLMFKIMILQRYYNLSDEQIEFQINDRFSFMRFLNLTIADDIPDSRTVWKFKEQLVDLKLIEPIFNIFLKQIENLGMILNEGKIIDASFIEVPKQRNTKEENKQIKEGEIPESITKNPHKKAQKDTDARWTQKGGISYFGYKNHVKVDARGKIITKYKVTPANVHDSQVMDDIITEEDKGQPLYADSAYSGEPNATIIAKKEMKNQVHAKGYKNKPLTEEEFEQNRQKSSTRARVEHVFGFIEGSMNTMKLKQIGIKRVEATVGMMNLVYNMFRKIQLQAIS
jgi:transposase, IS5 family